MRKLFPILLLIVISLSSLALVSSVHASISFHGVITSDTTWTKANSPYTLDGPTAVNQGVTLTIEPGVTVNLNNHYIQVNGTLIARGNDNDKIYFGGGTVSFTSISQQSGQASTFENTVTDALSASVSLTITKNYFKALDLGGGSSTVSYNTIESIDVGDSSTVTNNQITKTCWVSGSPTVNSNDIDARVIVTGGNPKILNNKISDGIHCDANGAQITITSNEIHSKNTYARILVSGSHADISNNIIIGNSNNKPMGITVNGILSSATITGNQIYNCQKGIDVQHSNVQISKNVIIDCDLGIDIAMSAPIQGSSSPWNTNPVADVKSNTITRNTIGIQYHPYVLTSTISNNNMYDNSQYNFKLVQFASDVTLSNNWWGTTDAAVISQKIYDFQLDFNLGKVLINPLLIVPASDAPAIPENIPTDTPQPTAVPTPNLTQSQSTPTTQPTQNPNTTSSQPGTGTSFNLSTVEVAILAVLIVIAVLLAVLIVTLRKRY